MVIVPIDKDTFERFKRKDHHAFARIHQTYGSLLYLIVYSIVKHREDTEDILQDTWLKIFHHASTCRSYDTFQAWLILIARNTALNALAKKRDITWQDAFDHHLKHLEDYGELTTWHTQLTDKENLILAYKLVYGLGFEDIATLLHHATSHVYTLYQKALEKIKEDYPR